MANWWLNWWDRMSRDPSIREGRSPGRTGGKSPGKATGKTAGKTAGKAAGMGEASRPDRTSTWALGLALAILVLHLALFLPVPRLSTDFPAAGQIAESEIRAPFPFEAPKLDRDVQMERLERVVVEPPVLVSDEPGTAQPRNARMELFLDGLAAVLADTSGSTREKIGLLTLQYPTARPDEIPALLKTPEPDSLVVRMERAWTRVMQDGVTDMLPVGKYDRIVVLTPSSETLVGLDQITIPDNLEKRLATELMGAGLKSQEAGRAANVMRPFITPNLTYEPAETRKRQDAARESVSATKGFLRDERIVDQGVRVTEQQALYLEELKSLLLHRGGGDDGPGRLSRFIVRGLLVAVALGLFAWLAIIHFPVKLSSLRFLLALATVLAVYLTGAWIALSRPALGPLAVPVILLSLFATVLFKARVGYTTTLLGVSLLAFLPGVGPASIFAWYILGMVTVVSVRRIQKRSQFYQTILLLTFLAATLIFLLGPEAFAPDSGTGHTYLVGLFTPVLLVAFGLFLLPVIEPLVGVCSDLTLLELSDLNHPLLKRMALEAQGTYHHSQVVGQLAEHAARAIDANALLTRVGALFHDIGKMQKSEYYVENQRPEFNKHDELSPSMSALVIAAHVKDGIELGRKWRLPQMVIDFIPEHHGTMVMEFFYHKALEAEGNETVKVDDFRYPGPKPRSRETAILMMADAVEAATRSLAKPTPSRIREITKQIIDKRMLSGEMDESGLTLSDLAKIREAFIPLLTGIHHSRIVYPGQKDKDGDRVPERRGERKAGS
jgi:putative nucleotidyltransferase with HDIG domain